MGPGSAYDETSIHLKGTMRDFRGSAGLGSGGSKGLREAAGVVPFLRCLWLAGLLASASPGSPAAPADPALFEGRHYRGRGDTNYLHLLETARSFFEPNPARQNLTMLYEPKWNGLVEGPTWDAWWIQNSYGTTFSLLPWIGEPFVTFVQNSQDLWFDQMGDGKRVGAAAPFDWVAPDGCLCDAARPGWIVYKQGDGRTAIHDWGMEFTAAGILLQAELLLIGRDTNAIQHYLPMLERSARFIETRRATNNLFLAGPAANLLAPSFAGWKRPDGTYDKAYLTGLSVTYIAALDRLIELEQLARRSEQVRSWVALRQSARDALPLLTTEEGYLIRSLDPDGMRHGVYGAPKYGYFEASPNHDAIAFRVVSDSQAEQIYKKIASIPGLRPHCFVLPNFPSYDDMYEKPEGLWGYGTWVNGGHWSTCEARMILAYYRLGQFEDARLSLERLMSFAERFRMDNPLTECGNAVYQPNQPVNLCYDTFGPAAAFVRGLFEYVYSAEGLTLLPHLPPSIRELQQLDPVRFGQKRITISVAGAGPVSSVKLNNKPWARFDSRSVYLPYAAIPNTTCVQIGLGGAKPPAQKARRPRYANEVSVESAWPTDLAAIRDQTRLLRGFQNRLERLGLGGSYEAAHARLAVQTAETVLHRRALVESGRVKSLPEASQQAADKLFVDAAVRLATGLQQRIESYQGAPDGEKRAIFEAWSQGQDRRRF